MAKFYEESIWMKHEALTAVRAIYRSYGVKFRIRWDRHGSFSKSPEWYIQLGLGMPYEIDTIQSFLSKAFHELAHLHCFENRKYVNYHSYRPLTDVQTNILAIKTAIRAEKYTDRVAQKLMNTYFPGIPYKKGYDKEGVQIFREVWLDKWKLKLGEHILRTKGLSNVK
jgi:hypothetical protein